MTGMNHDDKLILLTFLKSNLLQIKLEEDHMVS